MREWTRINTKITRLELGFSNVCQIKDYRTHFRNIGHLTWLIPYDLYAIGHIDDTLFYFSKTVPINFCVFGSEFHWDCILSERRTRKWRIPYCCTNFLGLNLKSWAYIAFHNLYKSLKLLPVKGRFDHFVKYLENN